MVLVLEVLEQGESREVEEPVVEVQRRAQLVQWVVKVVVVLVLVV